MTKEKQASITKLRNAIKKLPYDEVVVQNGIWYTTQKEHWLGWLRDYNGPGAYGRKNWNRDAKFVYNHIVCPGMLMYLIYQLPIESGLVAAAEEVYRSGKTEMARAGAIRKIVPWQMIYQVLWGEEQPNCVDRLFSRTGKK